MPICVVHTAAEDWVTQSWLPMGLAQCHRIHCPMPESEVSGNKPLQYHCIMWYVGTEKAIEYFIIGDIDSMTLVFESLNKILNKGKLLRFV
jgi:hypothetical protein